MLPAVATVAVTVAIACGSATCFVTVVFAVVDIDFVAAAVQASTGRGTTNVMVFPSVC